MKNILVLIQIAVSLTLIFLILLQSKGTGLRNKFGGGSDNFSTKRGVERIIFILTIIFSVIFIISSLIQSIIFNR